MKHIRAYKLFESEDINLNDIRPKIVKLKSMILDMSVDLSDNGFKVIINSNRTHIGSSIEVVIFKPLTYDEYHTIDVDRELYEQEFGTMALRFFSWSQVSNQLEFMSDILSEYNANIKMIDIRYDVKDEKGVHHYSSTTNSLEEAKEFTNKIEQSQSKGTITRLFIYIGTK